MPCGFAGDVSNFKQAPSSKYEHRDYKNVMLAVPGESDNQAMKLLVIEDEPKLAQYLRKALTESSYVVDLAYDGAEGCYFALEYDYDLIVLDVMLPKLDGFSVLQTVRRKSTVPVLMLTARDQVDDRVRGLQAGADDYLVKPFALSELLARVQALLRRGQVRLTGGSSTELVVADLTLDLLGRKATRGGQRLDLTPKEFTLLSLLMRRKGEVLARSVLAEQVWGMHFDSNTNVVEVAIRRLRGKVDDSFDAKLLHTVRGMGYVLEVRAG